MNQRIFRKVSLARLSSPEQLDEVLRVSSPKSWLALVAFALVVGVVVTWGFAGEVPTTAPGDGVLVRPGGVLNVVARDSGLVAGVTVGVGAHIKANQVVAHIAQPLLMEKIRATQDTLHATEMERSQAMKLRQDAAGLQIAALDRQKENLEREITELQGQEKYAAEQIPIQEQLLAKGLVTQQQTVMAEQKLTSIRDDMASRRALIKQNEAQRFAQETSPEQSDVDYRNRIRDVQQNLTALQKQLDMSAQVVTPYGGQVIELKVDPGAAIAAGQAVLTIQPDSHQLEVLVYVSALQAKQVQNGMQVQISPTMVKREEFGFMWGHVIAVTDYPATSAALMRSFQNDALVGSITKGGPVNEMRVAIDLDPATKTGYKWSSSSGPPIVLSSGTVCNINVITRTQTPASLVLPFLKEKLGVS